MYRRIDDFVNEWKYETEATLKVMRALTDESLRTRVSDNGRSLGQLAWHVALSGQDMLNHAGLAAGDADDQKGAPPHAADIVRAYENASAAVAKLVPANWNDAALDEEVDMYGERWKRGFVLRVLISHQAHHRGQMTVLMRQSGLAVPGVYGPAREEWGAFGMQPQI